MFRWRSITRWYFRTPRWWRVAGKKRLYIYFLTKKQSESAKLWGLEVKKQQRSMDLDGFGISTILFVDPEIHWNPKVPSLTFRISALKISFGRRVSRDHGWSAINCQRCEAISGLHRSMCLLAPWNYRDMLAHSWCFYIGSSFFQLFFWGILKTSFAFSLETWYNFRGIR